jgi:hypothetical protein
MRYIIATIELPESISFAEAKRYIVDELAAAGGYRRTDDPLQKGLKVKAVAIKKIWK